MANSYFNHSANRVPTGARARADHINNVADEIASAFDKIPDQSANSEGRVNFVVDSGTANNYVVDLTYPPTTLNVGLEAVFKVSNDNTGASTINVNSLGAKALKYADGSDLQSGDLVTGQIVEARYDGTQFLIVSSTPKLTSDAKASALAAAQSAQEAADSAALAAGKYTTSEFCPGYAPVYDSANTFHIAGIDVTNLFNVGRRLKFIDGGATKHGEITASSFTTNTDVTVQMDAGENLSSGLTEVCMVTGTSAWSPILQADNPLYGTALNGITSGQIGSDEVWVAVGNGGNLMTSIDGGLTWAKQITGTTNDLLCVGYSSQHKQFMVGAANGMVLYSYNGVDWVISTNGLAESVYAIHYGNDSSDGWYALHGSNGGTTARFSSSWDLGVSWSDSHGGNYSVEYFPNGRGAAYVSYNDAWVAVGNDVWKGSSARYMYSQVLPTYAGRHICAASIENIGGYIGGTDAGDISYSASITNGSSNDSFAISSNAKSIFGTSAVRAIGVSQYLHPKAIAVGDNAKIAYSTDNGATWTAVSNGFFPTSKINAVHYSERDLLFIAVSSAGEVCRSTNGTN